MRFHEDTDGGCVEITAPAGDDQHTMLSIQNNGHRYEEDRVLAIILTRPEALRISDALRQAAGAAHTPDLHRVDL